MVDSVAKLDQSLQRLPLVENMIRCLDALCTYLKPEAVAHPVQLIRDGVSISRRLDDVGSGVDRVQSLTAWNLSRLQRPEQLAAILSPSKNTQYEGRQAIMFLARRRNWRTMITVSGG